MDTETPRLSLKISANDATPGGSFGRGNRRIKAQHGGPASSNENTGPSKVPAGAIPGRGNETTSRSSSGRSSARPPQDRGSGASASGGCDAHSPQSEPHQGTGTNCGPPAGGATSVNWWYSPGSARRAPRRNTASDAPKSDTGAVQRAGHGSGQVPQAHHDQGNERSCLHLADIADKIHSEVAVTSSSMATTIIEFGTV